MEQITFVSIQIVLVLCAAVIFYVSLRISSKSRTADEFIASHKKVDRLLVAAAVILILSLLSAIVFFVFPAPMSFIVIEDEIMKSLPLLLAFRSRQLTRSAKRSLATMLLILAALLAIFFLFSCTPKATYEARLIESGGYHQQWECRTQACVDSLYNRADLFVDSVSFRRSARRWDVFTSPIFTKDPYPEGGFYAVSIPGGGTLIVQTKWRVMDPSNETLLDGVKEETHRSLAGDTQEGYVLLVASAMINKDYVLSVDVYGPTGRWIKMMHRNE